MVLIVLLHLEITKLDFLINPVKDDFVNLIIKCSEKGIVKKLIVPALEFHALNLIKLGNFESKEVRERRLRGKIRGMGYGPSARLGGDDTIMGG